VLAALSDRVVFPYSHALAQGRVAFARCASSGRGRCRQHAHPDRGDRSAATCQRSRVWWGDRWADV